MSRTLYAVLLLTLFAAVAVAQEEAFSSCPPTYSYCGFTGPEQWKNFQNSKCGGARQSPVRIQNAVTDYNGPEIQVEYINGSGTWANSGYDVRFILNNTDNKIKISGKTYTLLNFHFHTPSEHSLAPQLFAAELHFVHELDGDTSPEKQIAAIAVLMRADGSNEFLSPLLNNLPKVLCQSWAQSVDLPRLLPNRIRAYWTYEGSLTTPPCTETVTFYIVHDTSLLKLSPTQRRALEDLGKNNRPQVPIGRRPITLVRPR